MKRSLLRLLMISAILTLLPAGFALPVLAQNAGVRMGKYVNSSVKGEFEWYVIFKNDKSFDFMYGDVDGSGIFNGTWIEEFVSGRTVAYMTVAGRNGFEFTLNGDGKQNETLYIGENPFGAAFTSTPLHFEHLSAPVTASPPTSAASGNKPSAWAQETVDMSIYDGLVPQSLQSNYQRPISRAEFCALAVALYESETNEPINKRGKFIDSSDVNIEKIAGLGVVNGVGGGRFAPNAVLTREQAASILVRLYEKMEGVTLDKKQPSYTDNANISAWAREAVGQAQASGIMSGTGNNVFAPKSAYTREQAIVSLYRLKSLPQ